VKCPLQEGGSSHYATQSAKSAAWEAEVEAVPHFAWRTVPSHHPHIICERTTGEPAIFISSSHRTPSQK